MKYTSLTIISMLVCYPLQATQDYGSYLLVCGELNGLPDSGLNDKGLNNAAGVCLKVREIVDPIDGSLKRFTSTPSKATVEALGYTISDSMYNDGMTYAGISPWEPFALFRQDGGKSPSNHSIEGPLVPRFKQQNVCRKIKLASCYFR
ncbi:hypothetical protein [Vibrio hyugaensis]|uniref:hypothetical protein n=1 Tax=Vibrio hyugaensis TaxID=1534743 RepID=UPI0011B0A19A|nr:hypothetical protein [Vibrio hyugaensis]